MIHHPSTGIPARILCLLLVLQKPASSVLSTQASSPSCTLIVKFNSIRIAVPQHHWSPISKGNPILSLSWPWCLAKNMSWRRSSSPKYVGLRHEGYTPRLGLRGGQARVDLGLVMRWHVQGSESLQSARMRRETELNTAARSLIRTYEINLENNAWIYPQDYIERVIDSRMFFFFVRI